MHIKTVSAALLASLMPLAAIAAPAPTDTVVIGGQREHYRSLSATGATKTDAPLADLPQSVRVLTSEVLRDAGVSTLAGALDLASGVSRQSDLGGLWDSYAMRGFTGDPNFGSDFLVNGFSSSRGYNGLRDTANTQSIEVLKGPSAALYGRGEPGGTVNIVTKKPRFVQERSISASAGSFNTYRTTLDVTGPVSETLAYRINAARQQGESFRDSGRRDTLLLSPSFVWLAGEHTTVSYEIEATEQKAPFDRGVPALNGKLGALPASRFLGEPGDGRTTVKSLGHQLFVQHALNDDWSLQSGLSYRDSELAGFSTEANNLLADGRTLRRQRRHRDFSATDTSGRIELLGKLSTGGLGHSVLFGVDAYRFDDRRVQLRRNPSSANPYAIDIFQPVYGAVADPLTLSIDTLERQRAHGVYAQDQIDLGGQWKALLGIRYDSADQTVTNNRRNTSSAQSLHASSPRAGLVYQPAKALALYASAARAYRPNSGISIENLAFEAEKSLAYEAGAKVEALDGKLSSTVALYKIDKKNVLTTNPANTDFAIPAGEVGSRGLEVDVAGTVARKLQLSAAYAWTDATVTRGDQTIRTGSRFPNVARHSANVLLVSSFKLGDTNASLGAGASYVGKRMGDVAASSSFELPAYSTVKLVAAWAPDRKLRIALNIDNLFNKTWYASSYSQMWVAPGTGRAATLTASYGF
ncbi:TonB-dependent siderophore receptor [Massilia antarctica]|uniref:TonB-dependent siderophore receptor n=1 Tax=Massilia antarctica TaxID=2765360 RepID=UPI0006BB6E4F|nr:TonB-dependent siderophore receptor [Massilia sp. H27-R4]MCY0913501.1 TonB-dependent siderophore receptor [Massilia sp. H27-R4]CUI09638.1 Ferrichrome-iron receptor [Janthinobacterium sp. CG23_2]CUU33424.1 Ferrichrome-iron receptor [Janthinobacterium sp. CG23_2]